MSNKDFKFVSYLWDEEKAKALAGDEVGLLVYRSNLLGADLRLTNYGGGNTSCKVASIDPLTKKSVEVMWVKGSGGDLGTMKKEGLAALYLDRLHDLQNIYKELYKRFLIPFYIPLLVLIPFLLILSSKESSNYSMLRTTTFLIGLFFIIFFEKIFLKN